MKRAGEIVLVVAVAAVVSIVITVLILLTASTAYATTVINPTEEASGFMGGDTINWTSDVGGYAKVTNPLDEWCEIDVTAFDDTFNATIGLGGNFNVYLTGSPYCSGTPITDFTTDGLWLFEFYDSVDFNVLVEYGTFCQGCDEPPATSTSDVTYFGATTSVDTTSLHVMNSFYVFLFSLFGMIWLLRKH